MRRVLLGLIALGLAAPASAQVQVLNGPEVDYRLDPKVGVSAAAIGSPSVAGKLYSLLVRYPPGRRAPPHTHPDERIITVLSGTLYLGYGPDRMAPERVQRMPTGTVFRIPAGTPHYGWARDGAVELQETGIGPTGTQLITNP